MVQNRAESRGLSGSASSSVTSSWVAPSPKWGDISRMRSRSAERRALPGLRSMAPGRKERVRASTPNLESAESREEALVTLERDTKAQTTHSSDDSRLRTMEAWLAKWGLPMYPPTIASIKALAASLKSGGYKSVQVYLHVYKAEAERRGYGTTQLQARTLKDGKRSCARGSGA